MCGREREKGDKESVGERERKCAIKESLGEERKRAIKGVDVARDPVLYLRDDWR